jgi:hypothetical protein
MKKKVLLFVMCLITSFCRTAVDVQGISGSGQTVYDNDTCEHTVTSAVSTVAPTCTDKGYTLFECDGCGMAYKGQFEQETEHSYAVVEELTADLYCYMECRYQCGNCYLTNDLNSDNTVDIRDIVRLKKYIAGVSADISVQLGDIDFSGGDADSADLTMLKKILLGIVKASEICVVK